jgi:tetratricopeptide (TPR) repeat protein
LHGLLRAGTLEISRGLSMSTLAAAPAARVESSSSATPAVAVHASKLSVWCDRLIEMGWLAAVIVVPLFFNIYSSRVFEPDKLTTLRSIALVMALAWLVKWIEELGNPNRDRAITWRTPLVLPTLIMVVVFMISTALSVAPRTSLLGSYQRLQGTYTTFAYIIVFLMILQGMRSRQQVDRLITTIVLTSLPVAIYGLLQRLQMDPLPWGGDTVDRVAGNMGNSIFIAAYLVMTFFLTLYRITDSFAAIFRSNQPKWSDVIRAGCYILIALFNAIVVLILAGSRGPQLGWLGGLMFFVLLLVQVIRRRKLRLGLTIGMIGVALAGMGFLYVLNVTRNDPNFAALRSFPLFNRLSSVMQTTDGTNAVRVLIWEGAANLVTPHDPLQGPDGTPDPFNVIRPLIGYGPESMYVAYNRFYPPRLANFEARNASPDRSHNETWDSLVITGGVGFLAYLFLFGSVLYYGFRWIGLIASRKEGILFVVLWIAGAAVGGIGAIASGNIELFGVGVAAGIVLIGLTPFLFISAIANARRGDAVELPITLSLRDQFLLIAIVSTVIAHFVEIHTGIAIASTRTHFWVLIGAMVVVGAGLLRTEKSEIGDPRLESDGFASPDASAIQNTKSSIQNSAGGGTRKQRRAAQQAAMNTARRNSSSGRGAQLPPWFHTAGAYGLVLGLILAIMAFDFTSNADRVTVPGQVFVNALTVVRGAPSAGVLAMFLITLLVGVVLIVAELRRSDVLRSNEQGLAAGAFIASLAVLIWVVFGTFIAGRLVDFITAQQNTVGGILAIADQLAAFPAYIYLLILTVMIAGAFFLAQEQPVMPAKGMSAGGVTTLMVGAIAVPLAVNFSNLQPIAADIVYKQANPWDQQGARELIPNTGIQGWDLAIEHYRRAIDLARNEDFYYLWLGRALLEKAKSTPNTAVTRAITDTDTFERVIGNDANNWNRLNPDTLPSAQLSRDDLFAAARIILEEARVINPFNTDHSANLARMWRQSADLTVDAAQKQARYENSSREYGTATSLSPNNAALWNEWASLQMYNLRNLDEAKVKLDRSLALDKLFSQTYLLRSAWNMEKANTVDRAAQPEEWRGFVQAALDELQSAREIDPNNAQVLQEITRISLLLGDSGAAISATLAMVEQNPNDWNSLKNLAVLYSDTKQITLAQSFAERALALAPAEQQGPLQAFIQQLAAPR